MVDNVLHPVSHSAQLFVRDVLHAFDLAVESFGYGVFDMEYPFGIEIVDRLVEDEKEGSLIDPHALEMSDVDKSQRKRRVYFEIQFA